ncbi:UNVERIFIED_CONTAM: hypothetical protein FKN15_049618 [Acipenser sinensis]
MAAVSSQALKLRVIVEAESIRKITLDTRPESVDDLKSILKDKLKLDADFSLQCEDPDFDGELISLVDIDELPQKATLKLFMAEVETSSISTRDTELLSDVSSPEQLSRWLPGIFPMPSFAYEVEDSDEPDVGDAPVAILTVVSDDTEKPIHFNPIKISIVLESEVMVTNLPRLADAFLVMFGLIYALHLNYPKELANTFEFIQKILLGLEDGKLKPRLQALKNDLLIHV